MSAADAPPRKKPRNDPLSLQRDRIAHLQAHPEKSFAPAVVSKPRDPTAGIPEFTNGGQGSSSGAGSGEFHVYKASRRREYERLAEMEAENKRDVEIRQFEDKRTAQKIKDDEKTEKNRLKREKQRLAKLKGIQAEKDKKAHKQNQTQSNEDNQASTKETETGCRTSKRETM